MKKHQFEEILSGIGLIALLISYHLYGINTVTVLIFIKFILDTHCAIKFSLEKNKTKKEKKDETNTN